MTDALTPSLPHELAEDLDPETATFIRRVYADGYPPETLRAYRGDLAYYWAWRSARAGRPMRPAYPLPVQDLVTFISDHLGGMPADVEATLTAPRPGAKGQRPWKKPGPWKLSTLRRRLATLSKVHQVKGHGRDNPVNHPHVQELLNRSARAFAGGPLTAVRKKRAADLEIVEKMVATCGGDPRGVRDQAVLWVAFAAGGRRRSEIAGVDAAQDLERVDAGGVTGYLLRVGRRKTQQDGTPKVFPVFDRAADALEAWLRVSGITEGPLFRSFTRAGGLRSGISPATIYHIVRDRAAKAGLDPTEFGAHSLRSGFSTEAGKQDLPLLQAMALTDHSSMRTFLEYFQQDASATNPAARLSKRIRYFDEENQD